MSEIKRIGGTGHIIEKFHKRSSISIVDRDEDSELLPPLREHPVIAFLSAVLKS